MVDAVSKTGARVDASEIVSNDLFLVVVVVVVISLRHGRLAGRYS